MPSQREQICISRNLWGTEIHTDDSDPVAAAIHGGWIMPQFSDDQMEVLNLKVPDPNDEMSTDLPATLTAVPADGPMVPPPDMDLHITVLILPTLQKYSSSVVNGVKSREWGDNHDGMSFKIHQLDWVDEGLSRGEERSGEARRQRMRAAMSLMSLFAGDGERKKEGKNGVDSVNGGRQTLSAMVA